jgi:integrase
LSALAAGAEDVVDRVQLGSGTGAGAVDVALTAQTLLRHANLQTTEIYVAVSDPKRVEAIDRLDPGI